MSVKPPGDTPGILIKSSVSLTNPTVSVSVPVIRVSPKNGVAVGEVVGDTVGDVVGDAVGDTVGDVVGDSVGALVASQETLPSPT